MTGQPRRPAGSPCSTGGQYAQDTRAETELELLAPPEPADDTAPSAWVDATPVAVDEALAGLYGDQIQLQRRRASLAEEMAYIAGGRRHRPAGWTAMTTDQVVQRLQEISRSESSSRWDRRNADNLLRSWEASGLALWAVEQAQQPMHAEYVRRGGWARAFLAGSADGHVHSSMACSTCNRGDAPTTFQWMTDFSGADETTIVDAAGWRACTVCYPTAPVGTPDSLPTRMFSDEEKVQEQARTGRAAARAERDAKKIAAGLTPDGSPLTLDWSEDTPGWDRNPDGTRTHSVRSRPHTRAFKTERAATQWLVQEIAWGADWDGPKRPAFDAIVGAVATKHGSSPDDVRAELAAKVSAKIRRDS